MLITLQEGCDYIIRRKANAALGLIPEWRDHLLATWEDDRTTTIGGIPVNLSVDVLDSHRTALRDLRDSYWLAVEVDLDEPAEKRMLTFIDDIPDDFASARVTRTSLGAFIRKHLHITVSEWQTDDPPERLQFDDKNPFGKQEKTLLCILALAAREIAANDEKFKKADSTENHSAIAKQLMTRLDHDEGRNGLGEGTIRKAIGSALEEITVWQKPK